MWTTTRADTVAALSAGLHAQLRARPHARSPSSVLAPTRTSSPRTAARVRCRARVPLRMRVGAETSVRSSSCSKNRSGSGSPPSAPNRRARPRQPTCAAAASSWATVRAPRRDSQAWDLRRASMASPWFGARAEERVHHLLAILHSNAERGGLSRAVSSACISATLSGREVARSWSSLGSAWMS